jgi:hypothetical protein
MDGMSWIQLGFNIAVDREDLHELYISAKGRFHILSNLTALSQTLLVSSRN